jgi:DNA repair protein RadA/Sms
MAKPKTQYVCQNCGAKYPKWQGQCTECGEWNTLVEEIVESKPKLRSLGVPQPLDEAQLDKILQTRPEIKAASGSKSRFSTKIGELDRVLGGGIVPGAVVLVGGEPGIGKSTLLTQVSLLTAAQESGSTQNSAHKQAENGAAFTPAPTLYVCGEESPEQINLRINRVLDNEQFLLAHGLGQASANYKKLIDQNLQFVTTTDVDQVAALIHKLKPKLVVVDSIQAMVTGDLTGASGSVGQVRESTERLIKVAKPGSVPIFLVGHVTKEGTIAGPKTLEHMVDAVLQLEGERTGQFRMLRALKNRFGATDEVGVFKLVDYGYQEVTNPSELFLENQDLDTPGSAVACIMEGTRPLLLEVQALVNQSQLAMPRRVGRGIELSRIQVLAAVLQRHTRLPLGNYDIFLSAAGGFKVKEPAVDLALAAAISSSLNNKKIQNKTVFIGEVGLLGEIRPVPYLDRRIKEAKRLGFKQIISARTHKQLRSVLKEFGLLK